MINNRCFDMGGMENMLECMPNIMECPQERCCTKEYHHEVKHIIPVNTRIINHHIYHHTYVPMYTYTCCDVCSNVCDNKCSL